MTIAGDTKQKLLRLSVAFAVFWLPMIVFLKLAGEVLEQETLPVDIAVLTYIYGLHTAFLDSLFEIVTNLGGFIGTVVIVGVISLIFASRHQYNRLTILLASVVGAAVANQTLKLLFQRDRPSLWEQLVVETSYSFPSGHAMASAALSAALIVIFWNTRYRWLAVVLGAAYTLAIGFSRLYLGVHYPSDVIAGWCVSIAWVAVVVYVVDRYGKRRGAI